METPNDTLVGPGQSITDASGNVWTITPSGQVAVNGTVDTTTANVTHLAYADGLVWQENTMDLWWSKASPTASWDPPYGTTTVPVPVNASLSESVLGASATGTAVLTDSSGNTWAIVNGQVAVNGVIDPTTANVVELAYVNGKIWQENSQDLWWSKSAPADGWNPPYGTTTNPIQGAFYTENGFLDQAIINVGELTASPNGGSGGAPQSLSEIVTTGVKAAGTSIIVSTETATLVVDGNSSLTKGATLNVIGEYRTPGEVSGPVENNGAMTINASSAELGPLSGDGSIKATNGSTLFVQSASAGNTIQLLSSHLSIGGQGADPDGVGAQPGGMVFLAPITMDAASTITLNATTATSEVLTRNAGSISEVFLYNGTTEVADLKVHGVGNLYATQTGSGASSMVTFSTVHSSHDLPIVSHIG